MRLSAGFLRAESVEEAIVGLESSNGEGVLVAGGTVISSLINQRLAAPTLLIDISRIATLKRITVEPNGTLVIGAMVTHEEVLRSPQVRAHSPILSEIAREISCGRLRSRGTLGGSVCMLGQQGDPGAGLLALDAEVDLQGPRGGRRLQLRDFYKDAFSIDIAADEVLIAVRVPPLPARASWAFLKHGPRAAMDFTLIAVAVVLLRNEGRETIEDIRIGMNGVAGTALRATRVEAVIAGCRPIAVDWAEARRALDREISPPGDLVYSERYKRHLAEVLLRRAFAAALARRTPDGARPR